MSHRASNDKRTSVAFPLPVTLPTFTTPSTMSLALSICLAMFKLSQPTAQLLLASLKRNVFNSLPVAHEHCHTRRGCWALIEHIYNSLNATAGAFLDFFKRMKQQILRVEVGLTGGRLLLLQHVRHIRTGQTAQSRCAVAERDDRRR